MNIPDSIRIAGTEYQTKFSEHIDDGLNCLRGKIDYVNSQITIDSKCGKQNQCQTYLHEVLHGIARHYYIELPSGSEEDIIDKFATGLYQLLEDNAERLYPKGD